MTATMTSEDWANADWEALNRSAGEVLARASAVEFALDQERPDAEVNANWSALRALDYAHGPTGWWPGEWTRRQALEFAGGLAAAARDVYNMMDNPGAEKILIAARLETIRDEIRAMRRILPGDSLTPQEPQRDEAAYEDARRRYVMTVQRLAQRLSNQPKWVLRGAMLRCVNDWYLRGVPLSVVYRAQGQAIQACITEHQRIAPIWLYYHTLDRLVTNWHQTAQWHKINPYKDIPPIEEIESWTTERIASPLFLIELGRWGGDDEPGA